MATYLERFVLVGGTEEFEFLKNFHATCYNNIYPFRVLPDDFTEITLEPVTILYGGNGSGKSTILNCMAQALDIQRTSTFNETAVYFQEYVNRCRYEMEEEPLVKKILTSDDVFQNLFTLREKNKRIDQQREETMWQRARYRYQVGVEDLKGQSLVKQYDKLCQVRDANSQTNSAYVRARVSPNVKGKSNGETAMGFFADQINQPGLFLLDEPENSLSAAFQMELAEFLWNSARFFGAQLVIATHSPFLLAIPGAKIYNLDSAPVKVTWDWTTLENMQAFYWFFRQHRDGFEDGRE